MTTRLGLSTFDRLLYPCHKAVLKIKGISAFQVLEQANHLIPLSYYLISSRGSKGQSIKNIK